MDTTERRQWLHRVNHEIIRDSEQWYRFSQGEPCGDASVVFEFVALWVSYNIYYDQYCSSPDRSEARRATAIAGDEEICQYHHGLLDSDPDYAEAIDVIREKGIRVLRECRRFEIRDERDLRAVLNCLYAIRCNLFHGSKVPGNSRDERLLESANVILTRLLDRLLFVQEQESEFEVNRARY